MSEVLTFSCLLTFLFQRYDNRVLQGLYMGTLQDASVGWPTIMYQIFYRVIHRIFHLLEQTSSVDKFKLHQFKYKFFEALGGITTCWPTFLYTCFVCRDRSEVHFIFSELH